MSARADNGIVAAGAAQQTAGTEVVDQATALRDLVRRSSSRRVWNATRAVAFTSGKGGVGKTNLAANTAVALVAQGKRVLLVDADLGLSNVDVLLGLNPRWTLRHVLDGNKGLRDIVVEGPCGIRIIPAAPGLQEMARLSESDLEWFLDRFATFDGEYDFLLIDTCAGIGVAVMAFLLAAPEIVLVTTAEATAVTDAYALIKILSKQEPRPALRLVINIASNEEAARAIAAKIRLVAREFLNWPIETLAVLPRDEAVGRAVRRQAPFVACEREAPISKAVMAMARQLAEHAPTVSVGAGDAAVRAGEGR